MCVYICCGCCHRLDSLEIRHAVCALNTNFDCSPLLVLPPARRTLCVCICFFSLELVGMFYVWRERTSKRVRCYIFRFFFTLICIWLRANNYGCQRICVWSYLFIEQRRLIYTVHVMQTKVFSQPSHSTAARSER